MRPAWSVIIFTVISGLGFGTSFFVGLLLHSQNQTEVPVILTISVIAFVLITLGLSSSTFHLGHPERALKALTQWRSSWLSREGVLSIFTQITFALFMLLTYINHDLVRPLGYLLAILSLISVFCTAMIYANLKTVPKWHTVLTPICFLCFSIASGWYLTTILYGYIVYLLNISESNFVFQLMNSVNTIIILSVIIISWLCKLLWWFLPRANSTTGLTALGLSGYFKPRMMQAPFTADTWVQKEMVFKITRKYINSFRVITLILGLVLPLLLLIIAIYYGYQAVHIISFFLFFVGILLERWLFFAEAEHKVANYYR